MPRPQDVHLVEIDGRPDWLVAAAYIRSDGHYGIATTALAQICSTVHRGVDRWIGGAVSREFTRDNIKSALGALGNDSVNLVDLGPVEQAEVKARLGEAVIDAAMSVSPTQNLYL